MSAARKQAFDSGATEHLPEACYHIEIPGSPFSCEAENHGYDCSDPNELNPATVQPDPSKARRGKD